MKSLMRCYTYWPNIEKDIENLVKLCRDCALVAKSLPIKVQLWPTIDIPLSKIHIDFAGPINTAYYLVVVDSYTKWSEVLKGRRPTTTVTISFLHEIFARFGIPSFIVSDIGTQFTSSEFKFFFKSLAIEHIFTSLYHPRSNGQAERFVNTFKRALRKSEGEESDEIMIQQFLSVCCITRNSNNVSGMLLTELMFARKIRCVFNKLLPEHKVRT